MNGKQYVKNQLPILLLHLCGILGVSLFLIANDCTLSGIVFLAALWLVVVVCYLTAAFFSRKKRLNQLLFLTEQLDERYLIAELMPVPEKAEEQVFYQILKLAEASMLEKIEQAGRAQKAYQEYIEQWIHEIRTPITAMHLLCENNRSDFTRELLTELENVSRYTEQTLYYARSSHAQKDYLIREIRLDTVVHDAIADNKYLLRQSQAVVTVDPMESPVYTDDKWIRFILNQLISNAIKYTPNHPQLHFSTVNAKDYIHLSVRDNGIGIPACDLPRIFEKGFTGHNGRIVKSSTGIGLYLCKRLCDKLGIGLRADSDTAGTTVVLSFHINDFVSEICP